VALVSVIMATYNRSNVLAFSIRSVLAQTFQDWELLVIGDCCTDDTEAVVASFQDPRIRYVNLPKNYGNQYGPNNHGMELSKSRYFAFLNHDDLWWPDHLTTALSEIEASNADLVFTLGAVVHESGPRRLSHAAPKGRYEPYLFVPASLWLFRRELYQELGAWKDPFTMFNVPSQEWLHRAWKARKHLQAVPRLTALLIHSGTRKQVYARRDFRENQEYLEKILQEPGFRENELTAMAAGLYANLRYSLKWTLVQIIKRLLFLAGFEPISVYSFFLYPRRGGFVKRLKKIRGLSDHEKPRFDAS
jgi:glycosyltransferase involved in cell wall biosynthesis